MRAAHRLVGHVLGSCAVAGAAAAIPASAIPASAQPPLGSVRGVAFDSLRGVPLAEAFVTLGTRSVTADARGRFRFDGVAPGRQVVAVQHASLDAVGISGIVAHAVVTDGPSDVIVASPSFATLWRSVCGADPVPAHAGFVYGTVADARGTPAVGAVVDVTWIELGTAGRRRVVQRLWRGAAPSNASGAYAVCGVPTDVALRVQAVTDSASSGLVDLPPEHPRVLRRDLRVASHTGAAGAARGDVAGVVTDSTGAPVPNVRVAVDEAGEVRTDSAGRFVVRGVPTGTRQLELLALGMSPAVVVVDVVAGRTAEVGARLRRITKLDVVRVTASPMLRLRVERIEERRRLAAGYFRDSTDLAGQETVANVLTTLPGTFVEYARGTSGSRFSLSMRDLKGARCEPGVWIDAAPTDAEHLNMLRPREIAVIEVYPRAFGTPPEFTAASEASRRCGAVAVWTRFHLR